jgi:ribosome-associated toxin RatA of RatAB toxin-antitoxin module
MPRAEHTEVVDAPAEACFAELADLERYPDWQGAVKAVSVRERDGDGRPSVAQFRTDAKIREVRYVLRYRWDPPTGIRFDYVEGDAKRVAGEFRLQDLGDGRTRVTYGFDVDAGGPLVPRRVKQALAEQAVRGTLAALQRRVGRSHTAP